MYIPKPFKNFKENFSDVHQQYEQLAKTCREHGPLDQKCQDLVKLGIAIGQNSKGGVMSLTRKALNSGATAEEIHHAVLLSLTTVGFPAMIAAMGWAGEVLEKN
ncbi:MAG: carboxymuconolactone decarboxylase family protein [Desulfobacteraceae bacterium]|nr:carboxymuconolactone decarboxylase family protein [Desulfobacteraceae bacterium]MBC2756588.1 carboxymuconolactone decarboxylase family protein [Desulfobacteraceae bacterium]